MLAAVEDSRSRHTDSNGGARRGLPEDFVAELDRIEASCVAQEDPMLASGFGGGATRWRAERGPILEAVDSSGSILDVGCANGYLLECLVRWAAERGIELTPHGVDRSEGLIVRARARLPEFAGNMHVGDAWTWVPPARFDYVYALYDCVPLDYLPEYTARLMGMAVAPGGRLVLGAYGSRSRGTAPYDVCGFLEREGYDVVGHAAAGSPPVTSFAWVDRALAPD